MSDFDEIKHDYARYYPVIGIRVRGKWDPICIFKEYWYGRRADRLYYPYNPKTVKQQAWRSYFADGMAMWQSLTDEQKAQYVTEAKRFKLYPYHRFLHHYMLGKVPLLGP